MEVHAFGFKLRLNAAEGQSNFLLVLVVAGRHGPHLEAGTVSKSPSSQWAFMAQERRLLPF
jgi:hypothetical protein